MIIRPADFDTDALAIMDGAKDFVSRMERPDLVPADDAAFTEAVGYTLDLPGVEVLVVEHEGEIVAGLGLLFTPYNWNRAITVANELFWWASPDAPHRAAFEVFMAGMKMIRERGALPMFHALTSSPKGVDRAYRRAGMEPVETVYMGVPG